MPKTCGHVDVAGPTGTLLRLLEFTKIVFSPEFAGEHVKGDAPTLQRYGKASANVRFVIELRGIQRSAR